MSEAKIAKDFFNRTIKIGDICIYPVRRGAKMWLNRLLIQKISHDPRGEPKVSGIKQDGFPVNVTSLNRVVIVGRDNTVPFSEAD